MPAIDIAHLKSQATYLGSLFTNPEKFVRVLHETLDFYVNRTRRRGQAIAPASLLPTYRTPPLVLRYIQGELAPRARANPVRALELADELWDAGYLETRLLAAFLLGQIPPQEERLLARLTAWMGQVRDPNVRTSLLSISLSRLRKETPDRFLALVAEWLHPAREHLWSNGIRALLPLIADPDFENLPAVFRIVEPALLAAPTALQYDLEELILALHRASPVETRVFLKDVLARAETPQTAILLRRISPAFPPDLREALRDRLRPRR
ncbi:MAG: hypothetical protein D6770_05135 [Anaerolineae bacterium]|nr:MAG: hypothetical protein D6770_05135 [Anaerolineae bacterium]